MRTCPRREAPATFFFRHVRRYQKADWSRLQHFYRSTDWGPINIITDDPEESCQSVTNRTTDGMKQFIPRKMLRTKPSDPLWWTPECTAAVRAKKQAWKHYQNRRTSPGRHATYKQTAKASTVQLQTAKRQDALRIKNRLREGSVKNKQWWSLLKRAGG